jgi:hypothetical protein
VRTETETREEIIKRLMHRNTSDFEPKKGESAGWLAGVLGRFRFRTNRLDIYTLNYCARKSDTSFAAMTSPAARISGANICLSARGLKNVRRKENDFTFVVGSRRYPCPSFIAEFLSPRVHDLHLIDDTLSECKVEIEDPNEYFNDFLSLGSGNTIKVDESNQSVLLSICSELSNQELCEKILERTSNDITMSNVIDRVSFLSQMHCNILREIEFISSHFHEIDDLSTTLKSLTFSMIEEIIKNDSLKIKSEDSLYDFIVSQIETNWEYSMLLEYVRYEYLSTLKFNEFFDLISKSFEYMNHSIWMSLQSRLSLPVSPKTSNDRLLIEPRRGQEFVPSSSSPLNGIIAHLTRRCGGNVHDHNIIAVSASSNDGHREKNVADLEVDNCFISLNSVNQWLCYDFKAMTIKPTHYSIRSYCNGGPGDYNPKNWVIEGSQDGNSWIELDRQDNNNELNGRNLTRTFSISRSEEVRMIRIRQTGLNHAGDQYLMFSSFEIFGHLIEWQEK